MRSDDASSRLTWLLRGQLLTTVLALGALVVVIIVLLEIPGAIQTSRRDARADNCYLLRGLALSAAPPSRKPAVKAYFAKTPLANCDAYAQSLK